MILIYQLLDYVKSTVATFNHQSQVGIKYPEQFQYFKHNKYVNTQLKATVIRIMNMKRHKRR